MIILYEIIAFKAKGSLLPFIMRMQSAHVKLLYINSNIANHKNRSDMNNKKSITAVQNQKGQAYKNFLTSKTLLVIAILAIFIFGVSICPILNWLNTFSDTKAGHWFVLKNGVSDWFAFWGSFSGTLATILVGIATFRLTEHIENDRKESEKLAKKVSIVENMPNMYCKEARLYSFNRGDISNEHLTRFEEKNDYCLELEMTPAFPQYFGVSISEIQVGLGKPDENTANLSIDEYSFDNYQNFSLYINIPNIIESAIEDLYRLNLTVTSSTPHNRRNVQLKIRFHCGNALLPNIEGNVIFDMNLSLKSLGKEDTENEKSGMKFAVTNIQFLEADNHGAKR